MAQFIPKTEDLSQLQDVIGEGENIDMNLEHIPVPKANQTLSCEIKRENILDFGNEGFTLQNVLSPEECLHYINACEEIGFKGIYGAKSEYRNSLRIMVQSKGLASLLWERVQPFLDEIELSDDPHKSHIHGISTLLKGKWQPLELNYVFRLCKYEPGGHFAPHFDGHLVKSSEIRSMKTIMLYLNGNFEFGTTNFVDDCQTLFMDSEGKYCAEEKNILCKIKPKPGLALIFNHHRLHEGEAVRNGVKYILRTDIMYKRTENPKIDPKEEEALRIVQEAERLECSGNNMKAMDLYRKAFKMSPSLAAAYGN